MNLPVAETFFGHLRQVPIKAYAFMPKNELRILDQSMRFAPSSDKKVSNGTKSSNRPISADKASRSNGGSITSAREYSQFTFKAPQMPSSQNPGQDSKETAPQWHPLLFMPSKTAKRTPKSTLVIIRKKKEREKSIERMNKTNDYDLEMDDRWAKKEDDMPASFQLSQGFKGRKIIKNKAQGIFSPEWPFDAAYEKTQRSPKSYFKPSVEYLSGQAVGSARLEYTTPDSRAPKNVGFDLDDPRRPVTEAKNRRKKEAQEFLSTSMQLEDPEKVQMGILSNEKLKILLQQAHHEKGAIQNSGHIRTTPFNPSDFGDANEYNNQSAVNLENEQGNYEEFSFRGSIRKRPGTGTFSTGHSPRHIEKKGGEHGLLPHQQNLYTNIASLKSTRPNSSAETRKHYRILSVRADSNPEVLVQTPVKIDITKNYYPKRNDKLNFSFDSGRFIRILNPEKCTIVTRVTIA